jgi:hypothetical protein
MRVDIIDVNHQTSSIATSAPRTRHGRSEAALIAGALLPNHDQTIAKSEFAVLDIARVALDQQAPHHPLLQRAQSTG